MKFVLAGGGTGGHFFPIIAVAEKLNELSRDERIVALKLYYFGDLSLDDRALFENGIEFMKIPAGKLRHYVSILNVTDQFKTLLGIIICFVRLYLIYPDCVFAKGGFSSFPTLLAARFFRIPVIIHESDSVPGRVNRWAGKFAYRIAVSFKEAAQYFPMGKGLFTGNPIRGALLSLPDVQYSFGLDPKLPIILILGGSQGAAVINEAVIQSLSELVSRYQLVHQTGERNYDEVVARANLVLEKTQWRARYKPIPFLSAALLGKAASAASLVIARAGSGIFEIAQWGKPSIIIPITDSNADHQRRNAYAYGRTGACEVVEERNLTPNTFTATIESLLANPEKLQEMTRRAKAFSKPDAAANIARALIEIGLSHERH